MRNRVSIAIHGGAGVYPRDYFTPRLKARYEDALQRCLDRGWQVLSRGGSSLEAVERAVRALEDTPLFNAGRGSVLNELGKVECEAGIMNGDGAAGAVAGLSTVKNPIGLARRVLDDPDVVFVAGPGAERYADRFPKVKRVEADYFLTKTRQRQLAQAKAEKRVVLDNTKFGTVGAVARDRSGVLAAATSTGGLTNKVAGRVGDTPIIGAGTFAADGVCAVSCTGVGEVFIREAASHEVAARMRHGGRGLKAAVHEVVHDVLAPAGGVGGMIAVDHRGVLCLDFNSSSMYRAWRTSGRKPIARIFRRESPSPIRS
ncbi:MAG: isoaspartyl peptidase/L-asparaginase [Myxococcota bacterium]